MDLDVILQQPTLLVTVKIGHVLTGCDLMFLFPRIGIHNVISKEREWDICNILLYMLKLALWRCHKLVPIGRSR